VGLLDLRCNRRATRTEPLVDNSERAVAPPPQVLQRDQVRELDQPVVAEPRVELGDQLVRHGNGGGGHRVGVADLGGGVVSHRRPR